MIDNSKDIITQNQPTQNSSTTELELIRLAIIKNKNLFNKDRTKFVESVLAEIQNIRNEFIQLAVKYKILSENESENRIDELISCLYVEFIANKDLIEIINTLLLLTNEVEINKQKISTRAIDIIKEALFDKLFVYMREDKNISDYMDYIQCKEPKYCESNPKQIINRFNLNKILQMESVKRKEDITRIIRETYQNLLQHNFLSMKGKGATKSACFLYDVLSYLGFLPHYPTHDEKTGVRIEGINEKKRQFIKNRLGNSVV